MLVQDFLRAGGTLADLATKYAIKANRSRVNPSLVLLKYNQIDSPMGDPLVRECRGLILDEADEWRVVSRSFSKLHPDAAGQVGGEPFTFADLFWKTFNDLGWKLPIDPDVCVSFELMSKWNRIVVMHAEPKLRMIGVHDRANGGELPLSCMAHLYEPVRAFPLRTLGDVLTTFATMEPLKQEGYVIVDERFNRIKVKHPGYVAIHHLKDGCSRRRLVEIVQAGEVGEFLAYFPEWEKEFTQIQEGMHAMVAALESQYERIKGAETQKEFALEHARAFCVGKHTSAANAAADCAVKCVNENLTTYCARKKCETELASMTAWDEVADWCAKYTPPLYYPRPEWPPKGITPIVEEDT